MAAETKESEASQVKKTIIWVRHAESCANLLENKIVDLYQDEKLKEQHKEHFKKTAEYHRYFNNDGTVNIPDDSYPKETIGKILLNIGKILVNKSMGQPVNLCAVMTQKLDEDGKPIFDKKTKAPVIGPGIFKGPESRWLFHPPLSSVGIKQAKILKTKEAFTGVVKTCNVFITSATVRTIMTAIFSLDGVQDVTLHVVPYIHEKMNESSEYGLDFVNNGIPKDKIDDIIRCVIRYVEPLLTKPQPSFSYLPSFSSLASLPSSYLPSSSSLPSFSLPSVYSANLWGRGGAAEEVGKTQVDAEQLKKHQFKIGSIIIDTSFYHEYEQIPLTTTQDRSAGVTVEQANQTILNENIKMFKDVIIDKLLEYVNVGEVDMTILAYSHGYVINQLRKNHGVYKHGYAPNVSMFCENLGLKNETKSIEVVSMYNGDTEGGIYVRKKGPENKETLLEDDFDYEFYKSTSPCSLFGFRGELTTLLLTDYMCEPLQSNQPAVSNKSTKGGSSKRKYKKYKIRRTLLKQRKQTKRHQNVYIKRTRHKLKHYT
jgi:hypothetical protein